MHLEFWEFLSRNECENADFQYVERRNNMKEIQLPELIEDLETVVISYWHFEEGDPVEEGDNLVEVTIDNERYNIPSPVSGILNEVFFEEGDEVEVNEVIATVEEKGEGNFVFGIEEEK